MMMANPVAKVVLVVASTGFQPQEYGVPKQLLQEAGINVITASDKPGTSYANDQTPAKVDVTLDQLHLNHTYAGIFFIGGPGAMEFLDHPMSYRLLHDARKLGILYGAICVSPRILAHAGVLTGARATGWDGDGKLNEVFSTYAVTRVAQDVVKDNNIITAVGPQAAHKFGQEIVKAVNIKK
jgi:protease I